MKTALVLGGAACVWSDVRAALNLGQFHGVVTCNDVTAAWPGPVEAAVSLHPALWRQWIARRDAKGLPRPSAVLGHATAQASTPRLPDCITGFAEYRFPGQVETGSSGLFALKVALIDLGFDRAVLCGVPLNAEPHFFDAKAWADARAYRTAWGQALPQIKDRARSMSGWTAELLGLPDEEWLGL